MNSTNATTTLHTPWNKGAHRRSVAPPGVLGVRAHAFGGMRRRAAITAASRPYSQWRYTMFGSGARRLGVRTAAAH